MAREAQTEVLLLSVFTFFIIFYFHSGKLFFLLRYSVCCVKYRLLPCRIHNIRCFVDFFYLQSQLNFYSFLDFSFLYFLCLGEIWSVYKTARRTPRKCSLQRRKTKTENKIFKHDSFLSFGWRVVYVESCRSGKLQHYERQIERKFMFRI